MITKVSNKEVRSDKFSVLVPNIHQVIYAEGNHSASIEIEGGMSKPGEVDWIIYKDTLQNWESPHDNQTVSADKRDEIFERISESLKLLQMPHRFE